jgi:hypothetical protein
VNDNWAIRVLGLSGLHPCHSRQEEVAAVDPGCPRPPLLTVTNNWLIRIIRLIRVIAYKGY